MERSKNAAYLCSTVQVLITTPTGSILEIWIPRYYGHTVVVPTVSALEGLHWISTQDFHTYNSTVLCSCCTCLHRLAPDLSCDLSCDSITREEKNVYLRQWHHLQNLPGLPPPLLGSNMDGGKTWLNHEYPSSFLAYFAGCMVTLCLSAAWMWIFVYCVNMIQRR